jgi:hypothetical protein
MIIRPLCKDTLISEYIIYAYIRLYANSINENGEPGDFLKLYNISPRDANGKVQIPFNDYYCPDVRYHEILDEICETPYILLNGKRPKFLTNYEKTQVQTSVALGVSPNTSIAGFTKSHPAIIKLASLFV